MNLAQAMINLKAMRDEYQHTMYLAEHADNDTERIIYAGDAKVKLLKIRHLEEYLRTDQSKRG